MISELLTTLGEDFQEVGGGGVGRYSSLYVLRTHDSYRIAHVMGEELLHDTAARDSFMRSLSSSGRTRTAWPERIGKLSRGVYWLSGTMSQQPRSLESLFRTSDHLSASDVAGIGERVCSALSELHTCDQVHGGLTSSNVFLAEGEIWLAEAGIRQALEAMDTITSELPVTSQSSYSSPEEVSGHGVSAQSEVSRLASFYMNY